MGDSPSRLFPMLVPQGMSQPEVAYQVAVAVLVQVMVVLMVVVVAGAWLVDGVAEARLRLTC